MSDISLLEQHVLLAILRHQPSAYAIPIQQTIKDRTGKDHKLGTIYAALGRLEDKGFLASRQGEATAERGGKRKLYFSITASGRRALDVSFKATNALREGLQGQEVT